MTNALLFGLFAVTLLGIARFHKSALQIALGGLCLVVLTRLSLTDFALGAHLQHEATILLNLAGLLLGFSVLADYFERSHLPEKLTVVLPPGKLGAFLLLVLVAVLSSVLDNIAAALIGGSAAITLFKRKLHIGYLAAIVAASNAGGAGSVIGDTTTTMIWIAGASPWWVAEAAIGSAVALLFFGTIAAGQQHRLQPLVRDPHGAPPVDFGNVAMVALIIAGALLANVFLDHNPAAGVWAAILIGGLLKKPNWRVMPSAAIGMVFLTSLVLTASMMPVESLPPASLWSTFGLGIVSAFFDNIPLTALAIKQGGYDWGFLAFAVGYGGSMLWFGSSAGVAISGLFTEAKSAKQWVVQGWHVPVGYVLGFFALAMILGWHPHDLPKKGEAAGHHVEAPADGGSADTLPPKPR